MTHRTRFFGERRAYHHGRLREALIEAARLLVSERGPAGFTLADAAKLAGVTAAAPYRHFSDRNALLEELTRHGFELFGRALHEAWGEGQPDARTAMNRMGESYLDFARAEPGLYSAMFSNVRTLNAPEAGAAATQALDVLRQAAAALLREVRDGAGPTETRALAFEIWAASHGVATLTLAGHLDPAFEGADPAAILKRSVGAMIEAALRRGAPTRQATAAAP